MMKHVKGMSEEDQEKTRVVLTEIVSGTITPHCTTPPLPFLVSVRALTLLACAYSLLHCFRNTGRLARRSSTQVTPVSTPLDVTP